MRACYSVQDKSSLTPWKYCVNLVQSLMVIAVLILISAFFSVSEISLAAARKIKLRQMSEEGDVRAERVLALQAQP